MFNVNLGYFCREYEKTLFSLVNRNVIIMSRFAKVKAETPPRGTNDQKVLYISFKKQLKVLTFLKFTTLPVDVA